MKLHRISAALLLSVFASLPFRAAADAIYITSAGSADKVFRIGANGTQSEVLLPTLDNPIGIAFDSAGNIYVSNDGDGSIKKFPADNGPVVSMATGQKVPTGLAIGPDGVLYAAIAGDNQIVKIATPGSPTLFANLAPGSNPQGITFDTDGTLLVAAKGANVIRKFNPNGTPNNDDPIDSNGISAPVGVIPAGQNNIVIAHGANGGELATVKLKGNAGVSTIVGQLGTPTGLTVDSIGNYYVGTSAGIVKKVVGNTATDFATGIPSPGLLFARAAQFKPVAFKGESLTTPANTEFASLSAPTIGAGGNVAYMGKLLAGAGDVSAASDTGIWKTDISGQRTLVAREAGDAPGTSVSVGADEALFSAFSNPVINADGHVAFRGTLRKGVNGASATNLTGLWAEGSGGLALVARQGSQPPGGSFVTGSKFAAFQQFVLPDAGGLAFLATVSGTGVTPATNAGIWAVDGAGDLQLVARKGDQVTVNAVAKTIKSFTLFAKTPFSTGQTRSFATDGRLLFRATFTDGSTALMFKEFGTPSLEVVTYKNELLTIAPTGAKLVNPTTGAINSDPAVAFRSTLSGGGVTLSNNQAIYLRSGVTAEVARKGFVAPDTDDSPVFGGFSDPALNDAGEVAFRATLKATPGVSVTGRANGLWLGAPGALNLVARQGDQPPGIAETAKFTSFSQFVAPADGGLVFLATISGTGITTAKNQGLWQRDSGGALDIVIRKGDKVTVDGSSHTVASITALQALPFCSAHGRSVSPDGGVAVLLKFTDGGQAIARITLP